MISKYLMQMRMQNLIKFGNEGRIPDGYGGIHMQQILDYAEDLHVRLENANASANIIKQLEGKIDILERQHKNDEAQIANLDKWNASLVKRTEEAEAEVKSFNLIKGQANAWKTIYDFCLAADPHAYLKNGSSGLSNTMDVIKGWRDDSDRFTTFLERLDDAVEEALEEYNGNEDIPLSLGPDLIIIEDDFGVSRDPAPVFEWGKR